MKVAEPTLLQPTRLYSRSEIMSPACPAPATSGLYAWWFSDTLPVPHERCLEFEGKHLLYFGTSPTAPPAPGSKNKQSIRSRIRYHYQGTADGSTLRLSLGCLLGFQLRRVGVGGKRRTFAEREAELSAWMEHNAFVSWVEHPQPWEMEAPLLNQLSLPLNLDQNWKHPFHPVLTELRRRAKRVSLKLPIADLAVPETDSP